MFYTRDLLRWTLEETRSQGGMIAMEEVEWDHLCFAEDWT